MGEDTALFDGQTPLSASDLRKSADISPFPETILKRVQHKVQYDTGRKVG